MSIPPDFTVAIERQLFCDILDELQRAYETDDTVTYSAYINARFAVEVWYMRVGIARDKAYRKQQAQDALPLAA